MQTFLYKQVTGLNRSAGLLAVAVVVFAGCASRARPEAPSPDQAIAPNVAVATFDSLWKIVRNTYVDTAFVSRRWTAVRDSLRPRALTITRRRELDRLLAATLERIPDSHFYIIPASVAASDTNAPSTDGKGMTGVALRLIGDHVVVWRVDPGSPAALAGILPGQRVHKVGDREADASVRRVRSMPEAARPRAMSELLYKLNSALTPRVGDSVRLQLAGTGGRKGLARTLVAVPAPGRVSQFGSLPPIAGLVRASRLPLPGTAGCVGIISFNIWLPALVPDIERAVDSVRACSGVVMDLRGNPGGLGAMVMGVGGYFVDSVHSLGTMRMRQLSLNFVINPRRSRDDGTQITPFAGPLAILVDPMTASTSEIFATGMQRLGRARVFGERSAGAALPALMDRLPSGDVFVHAVADFTDPNGGRIEGTGVVPDEIIPLSEKELAELRDTALEAAMRWIGREIGVRQRENRK